MHDIPYSGSPVPEQKVYFSRAQLEVLDKLFPEVVMHPNNSEAELRQYFGRRQVVAWVKSRVK